MSNMENCEKILKDLVQKLLAVIFCPLKEGKDNNVLVPLWGNGRVTATKGLVKIRNISKK